MSYLLYCGGMGSTCEVAIVGGGPAGSIVAFRLAQIGRDVVLVDKGPAHRGKCCGHCLNPRALDLLQQAGVLESIMPLASGRTERLRVLEPGSTPHLEASLSRHPRSRQSHHSGILLRRDRFDQALIELAREAGVRVMKPANARLESLQERGGLLRIRRPDHDEEVLSARLVIGADGVGSQVARHAGVRTTSGRKFGFSFDVPATGDTVEPGTVHMYLDDWGYLGLVNEEGRVHGAALASSRHPQREPMALLRHMCHRHPGLESIIGDAVSGHDELELIGTGPIPWRVTSVYGPSWALVGDAAGYVEPFTGEGMTWAIHGGMLLADAIAQSSGASWGTEAGARYARLYRTHVRSRQGTCRLVSGILSRPRLRSFACRTSRTFPMIKDRFVRKVLVS